MDFRDLREEVHWNLERKRDFFGFESYQMGVIGEEGGREAETGLVGEFDLIRLVA